MDRRIFLSNTALATAGMLFPLPGFGVQRNNKLSEFEKRLEPVGRALELEDYYVWCNSPIESSDGRIHIFFSRWKKEKGMSGWINGSEIAHAIADHPEGPFREIKTLLAPRGEGHWDATTVHNPSIHFVDGKYALFFIGNSNGKMNTKRIGLALADSLEGPWERPDEPLLEPGPIGHWDDMLTTNPSFLKHPHGDYWLYYKSVNTKEYTSQTGRIRGNRRYGLAVSGKITGPYHRFEGNPVIDFSVLGDNKQFEDAYVWLENEKFKMLGRDLGVFGMDYGLYLESSDGKNWSEPEIAYQPLEEYFEQPPAPKHLDRYGRAERPQLLFQNGKPTYLFTASQGGKYETASSLIFKIR